jgi:hypothetical protein
LKLAFDQQGTIVADVDFDFGHSGFLSWMRGVRARQFIGNPSRRHLGACRIRFLLVSRHQHTVQPVAGVTIGPP